MSPASSESSRARVARKRIIVACDGTWQDADSNAERDYPWYQRPFNTAEHLVAPSNVTRLCRSIAREGTDESGEVIPQIVYYQSGIGSQNWMSAHIIGGATGRGISSNIRDAYSFICNNYEEGDEIFLFGFSRGAFTARSISSLIGAIGLLNEKGLAHFYPIFKDWENQGEDRWPETTPMVNDPWGSRHEPRPNLGTAEGKAEYVKRLGKMGLLREGEVKIRCCGVWDTVGSLGIPMVWFIPQPVSRHYSFVDTIVEPKIEYAFHAVALDEHRRPFTPTVWAQPDPNVGPKLLKQCWFRGVHSDVGGGSYIDQELANITLAWMISQLEANNLLTFNRDSFWEQIELSAQAQRNSKKDKPPQREIEQGQIHNSLTPMYAMTTGWRWRTPRCYRAPSTTWYQRWIFQGIYTFFGAKPPVLLTGTSETVHRSVRQRTDAKPRALSSWKLAQTGADSWEWRGTVAGKPEVMREDVPEKPFDTGLSNLEDQLRDLWPENIAKARKDSNDADI